MLRTLQDAMANILFTKLIDCFDDLEKLSAIQTSNEFKILTKMQTILDEIKHIEGESDSIDLYLVTSAWNQIKESTSAINKEYSSLLELIKKQFKITTPDDFLLLGTLINHEKYIIQQLNEDHRAQYAEYIKKANDITLNYRLQILNYNTADLQSRFFNDSNLINQKDIEYKKTSPENTIIYLDMNAAASILKNKKQKTYCLNGLKNKRISLVYSSYLVEDAINMNPIYLNEFLEGLSEITNNNMIGLIDGTPCHITEDIHSTVQRVKKYSNPTKTFERTRFIDVIRHYHEHPELRKGKKLNNAVSEDIIGFFALSSKAEFPGFAHIVRQFCDNHLLTDFISNGAISKIENAEMNDTIFKLTELFDLVNYETETVSFVNAGKIYSSYRDSKHLEHAYTSDYFVTDDIKLRARGKIIYSITGSRTKIINTKELFALMPTFCGITV